MTFERTIINQIYYLYGPYSIYSAMAVSMQSVSMQSFLVLMKQLSLTLVSLYSGPLILWSSYTLVWDSWCNIPHCEHTPLPDLTP